MKRRFKLSQPEERPRDPLQLSASFRKVAAGRPSGEESLVMSWWIRTKITALERSAAALEWLALHAEVEGQTGPPNLVTGLEGEKVGFFYLMRNGYTVVARRWSSNRVRGDLDLVAWRGRTLCITYEVKTRSAHDIVPAELSVDSSKRTVLRRLTRQYIRRLPGKTAPHVRFDILSIYLVPGQEKEISHFKGAFDWSESRREWD